MMHRYTLPCKTLGNFLKNVLNSAVKIVNFVKRSGTPSRLFKQFSKEMDSDYETILFYTAVRWLSKVNVAARFYKLKTEIKLFLETVKKDVFVHFFGDKTWLQALFYLADITEQFNKFNLRLQGPDTNIIQFRDILRGFVEKMHNWNCKVNQGNFAMFEKLSQFESVSLNAQIKQKISEHLQLLKNAFKKYFPDLEEVSKLLPRNLFSPIIDITTIPEEI